MPAERSQAAWPRDSEPRSRFRAIDLALVLAALAFACGLTTVTMSLAMMTSHPADAGALAAPDALLLESQASLLEVSGEPAVAPTPDHWLVTHASPVSRGAPVPQTIVHQVDRGPVDGDQDRRSFLVDAARQLHAPGTAVTRGAGMHGAHCCPR